MSLTRQVAHNMIYQVGGKILSTILGLAALAMMTRYLGQDGYGGYTTIVSFLQFFGILVDFGLTLTTVQMISEPNADLNKITSNIFTLRFFSAVIFLGIAPLFVLFFPYSATLKIGVAITSFSFLFIALNQVLIGLFQKNLRMEKVAIAENIGRVVLVAGVATAIYLKAGLLAIMLTVILGSFANFLVNFLFSLKYVRIKFVFDWPIWKEIYRRSWPIGLSIVFNLIYLKADVIILSLFQSQATVGLYGASYRVLDVLTTLPMMFAGLILPVLTSSWAEKNLERFSRLIKKSFDFLMIVIVPIIFGTMLLGERIMSAMAGEDFKSSGVILKILILAAGAIFVGTLFGHVIVAIKKQKQMIWGYASVAFLSLAGYVIFIPLYTYWAAAWITFFSEGAIALLTFFVVWKNTRLIPSGKVLGKSILASLFMSAAIYFLIDMNLLLLIFLGAAIYFTMLYLLRGYNKETVIEILKLK
ncbi:MAG: flippase [Patescibacteria group bacterium]|jgi:O-antigen/teichoic acid export membrane protein